MTASTPSTTEYLEDGASRGDRPALGSGRGWMVLRSHVDRRHMERRTRYRRVEKFLRHFHDVVTMVSGPSNRSIRRKLRVGSWANPHNPNSYASIAWRRVTLRRGRSPPNAVAGGRCRPAVRPVRRRSRSSPRGVGQYPSRSVENRRISTPEAPTAIRVAWQR